MCTTTPGPVAVTVLESALNDSFVVESTRIQVYPPEERRAVCPGGSVQYVCTVDVLEGVPSITWKFQGLCSSNDTQCGLSNDMTISASEANTEIFTLCGMDLSFSYDFQRMNLSHLTLSLPQPLQLPLEICLKCESSPDYKYLSVAGMYTFFKVLTFIVNIFSRYSLSS